MHQSRELKLGKLEPGPIRAADLLLAAARLRLQVGFAWISSLTRIVTGRLFFHYGHPL